MPNQIRSRRQRAIQPFVQKRMALALAAAFSMPSIAATVNWDGGGNNSFWSTATNWDGNVLPGSLDAVVIGSGFSVVHNSGTTSILSLTAGNLSITGGSLSMSAASSISQLTLTGATLANSATTTVGSATLTGATLNGSGKTILASGGNHSIGGTGYIYNYVNQGHTLQNEGQLQISSTGSGQKSLSIAGSSNGVAASRLVNKGEMTLAADANASVQINRGGGNADAAFDNSGKLTKNGAGLASIGVRFNNTGTVALNDGILSLDAGSTHSAASDISGNGILRLNGGTHSFADGYVSSVALTRLQGGAIQGVAGGAVTFLGTLEGGGVVRNAASLQVANANLSYTTMQNIALARLGNANLTVITLTGNGKTVLASGGSHVLNGTNTGYTSYLQQGHTLQNDGQFRVDAGAGQSNNLYIDGSSTGVAASRLVNTGEMTLSSSGGNLTIRRHNGNNDVVFENSGKLVKDGTGNALIYAMNLQNTGEIHVQQGRLQYWSPPMQNNGRVIVDAGATFEASLVNNGRLMGNGTVLASAGVENHGIVAPGASAGTLNITGNYVQGADGRLDIELGGVLPGIDFDRLLVSGNATLNGVLDVTHLAGYAPKIGDSFIVLASSRLYGAFSSLALHGFGAGTQINVSYLDGNDADSYADYVRLDVAAVPEPETYAMMLAGLGVVGWSLRKRKLAMH